MKVWITKYALTDGVFETDVDVSFGGLAIDTSILDRTTMVLERYYASNYEWHDNKEKAERYAERVRLDKIRELEEQMLELQSKTDRLKGLCFLSEGNSFWL